MMKITEVVLPNNPQFDPLVAYYLITRYGRDKFPGIETAKISVWTGGEGPSDKIRQEWREKGVIAIDVGGGQFDHHGKGQCASCFAADYLGIRDLPELQSLLQYAQEDDDHGLHNKWGDLAYVIKCLYSQGAEIGHVVYTVFYLLDALQNKEQEWHVVAKKEFEKNIETHKVARGKSKLKVGVLYSDNLHVANYARREKNYAVIIQFRSSGHVFIFTNKVHKIRLDEIVGAVRLRELDIQGRVIAERELRQIRKTGKHPYVLNWYYHDALNALMNGSEALSDTTPTRIKPDELVQIVLYGISEEAKNDKDWWKKAIKVTKD